MVLSYKKAVYERSVLSSLCKKTHNTLKCLMLESYLDLNDLRNSIETK